MGNCGRSLIWLECVWLPNALGKPVMAPTILEEVLASLRIMQMEL